MKYLTEYRDGDAIAALARRLRAAASRSWSVMEVCGGQTHSIVRHGLDDLLAGTLRFVHGPGCPVCVTPVSIIDRALAIAALPAVTLCSFGDMLRVPGTREDLSDVRARGGDVRIVYSPLDAVKLAASMPAREVVFFAVGFETTAPAVATAVWQARALSLSNFSLLVAHVRTPPAIAAILQAPGHGIDGFLAPGHVCAVRGYAEYEALATHYRVPIVVTGFEPLDILDGARELLRLLEAGRSAVVNRYARGVRRGGNASAQRLVDEVFEIGDRAWRGIGMLPKSGLRLTHEFRAFDAARRFVVDTEPEAVSQDCAQCIAGEVLRGRKRPDQCPQFGTRCTPQNPLGATMVSAEGACAAYYRYRGTAAAWRLA